MELFRVFPWDPAVPFTEKGGPLFVPRSMQGQGRHDIPELDGVIYCSQSLVSAIAEFLVPIASPFIGSEDFYLAQGRAAASVQYQLGDKAKLLNLDSPSILSRLEINPSQVITHRRDLTRKISERVYHEGYDGFLWPSSIEGLWVNVTLFQSRVMTYLKIADDGIKKLDMKRADVLEACRQLRIRIKP